LTWVSIDRSESIKTPRSRADEDGSMGEEPIVGPATGSGILPQHPVDDDDDDGLPTHYMAGDPSQ